MSYSIILVLVLCCLNNNACLSSGQEKCLVGVYNQFLSPAYEAISLVPPRPVILEQFSARNYINNYDNLVVLNQI